MAIPGVDDIADAVRDFVRAADALQERSASRLDLAVSDLRAMGYLMEKPGMSPGELADKLQLTSGSITVLLRRLSAAGLTVRMANPHDMRGSFIHLSDLGIDTYTGTSDVLAGAVAEAAGGLTPEQHQAVVQFIRTMTDRCTNL